jgi:hypothetical protein
LQKVYCLCGEWYYGLHFLPIFQKKEMIKFKEIINENLSEKLLHFCFLKKEQIFPLWLQIMVSLNCLMVTSYGGLVSDHKKRDEA